MDPITNCWLLADLKTVFQLGLVSFQAFACQNVRPKSSDLCQDIPCSSTAYLDSIGYFCDRLEFYRATSCHRRINLFYLHFFKESQFRLQSVLFLPWLGRKWLLSSQWRSSSPQQTFYLQLAVDGNLDLLWSAFQPIYLHYFVASLYSIPILYLLL